MPYSDRDVTELLDRYEAEASDRISTCAWTAFIGGGILGFLLALFLYGGK